MAARNVPYLENSHTVPGQACFIIFTAEHELYFTDLSIMFDTLTLRTKSCKLISHF